ncbi:hypothetical protein [Flammeovirga agarivorans]|uniref:Uncharacterized protein n=1 Tax=Flammeovirga agarivorans TaxID=2726742 RepID=A0A7X8XZE8_9BACT|nr:hypothetical protein [Flammeovirga agarivorans]NLR94983.1 hypothetical protein [Flammeovirga agarivorans]
MKRIYLDWNVISNLKRKENTDIYNFLIKNKDTFTILYSPAHFSDFLKSYNTENDHFFEDLNTLESLCDNHLIRWENDKIALKAATPREYFNKKDELVDLKDLFSLNSENYKELDTFLIQMGIEPIFQKLKNYNENRPSEILINSKNDKYLNSIFPNLDNNSSFWDLMVEVGGFFKQYLSNKDFYKTYRKSLEEIGFKLEVNASNWPYKEVFHRIDDFLKSKNINQSFIEYAKSAFHHKNYKPNNYELFTSTYYLLDLLGYKPDSLKKRSNTFQNIQFDAEHSFYASFCDFFVVDDIKLREKSKVLYHEFNIPTKTLPLSDLINTIKKEIPEKTYYYSSQDIIDLCNKSSISYGPEEKDNIKSTVYKLPFKFLNYFNYLYKEEGLQTDITLYYFRRVQEYYDNGLYFTEIEKIGNNILSFLGVNITDDTHLLLKNLSQPDNHSKIKINLNDCTAFLGVEENTLRPLLEFLIKKNGSHIEKLKL